MSVPLLGGGGYDPLPDLGGISQEELVNGAKGSLLVCDDCNTIEYVPAFDGPPEWNQPLLALLEKHRSYVGGTFHPHTKALTAVNAKLWETNEDFRKYIVKAINAAKKTGEVGLGTKMYDLRNTFEADAFSCWTHEHNRTENCEDYRSDKKRLVQNDEETRSLRREAGVETRTKQIYTTAYLCDFCPYKTKVMERVRKSQGFY